MKWAHTANTIFLKNKQKPKNQWIPFTIFWLCANQDGRNHSRRIVLEKPGSTHRIEIGCNLANHSRRIVFEKPGSTQWIEIGCKLANRSRRIVFEKSGSTHWIEIGCKLANHSRRIVFEKPGSAVIWRIVAGEYSVWKTRVYTLNLNLLWTGET